MDQTLVPSYYIGYIVRDMMLIELAPTITCLVLAGDSFRGATWISLHNGGGVGWGEVINGGFGMVIDGSEQSDENIKSMLHW
eukprot:snap_masked-scaffold1583_size34874-processed-gene-0.0 protein:Tk11745 transcript:snap_masked-scaffold1583_size34874-processed-gene-0.0-mRNA-1 annotation:"urocanate hydratase"